MASIETITGDHPKKLYYAINENNVIENVKEIESSSPLEICPLSQVNALMNPPVSEIVTVEILGEQTKVCLMQPITEKNILNDFHDFRKPLHSAPNQNVTDIIENVEIPAIEPATDKKVSTFDNSNITRGEGIARIDVEKLRLPILDTVSDKSENSLETNSTSTTPLEKKLKSDQIKNPEDIIPPIVHKKLKQNKNEKTVTFNETLVTEMIPTSTSINYDEGEQSINTEMTEFVSENDVENINLETQLPHKVTASNLREDDSIAFQTDDNPDSIETKSSIRQISPKEIKHQDIPEKDNPMDARYESTIEPEKKKKKKPKKKPALKEEWENWVEPEYERPVLEAMPEKIAWTFSKSRNVKKSSSPDRKQKLVPIKIQKGIFKPSKLMYSNPQDQIQFATIKLRKAVIPAKTEVASIKLPKVLLRSWKTFHDHPPVIKYPIISFIDENPVQVGLLSRNIEEALKLPKTKTKGLKLPKREKIKLETLDQEFEELKKVPLERIDDKSFYKRQPKQSEIEKDATRSLVITKGKIPEVSEDDNEHISLQKIPEKVQNSINNDRERSKERPSEKSTHIKLTEKPVTQLRHDDTLLSDFEQSSLEKYIPPIDKDSDIKKPETSPKLYKRKSKAKVEQEIEKIPIIPGSPKAAPTEEPTEMNFRIPENPKPNEYAEHIRLKGWTKDVGDKTNIEEVSLCKTVPSPKKPKETVTEDTIPASTKKSPNPKKLVKLKTKQQKTIDLPEWVEPEYERPILEPMPEKINWEPSKEKKEKDVIKLEKSKLPQKSIDEIGTEAKDDDKPEHETTDVTKEDTSEGITMKNQNVEQSDDETQEEREAMPVEEKPTAKIAKKSKKKPLIEKLVGDKMIEKEIIKQSDDEPQSFEKTMMPEEQLTETPAMVEAADEETIEKLSNEADIITKNVILRIKSKKKPIIQESGEKIEKDEQIIKQLEDQPQNLTESMTIEEKSTVTIEKPRDKSDVDTNDFKINKKSRKVPVRKKSLEEITIEKRGFEHSDDNPQTRTEIIPIEEQPTDELTVAEVSNDITIEKPKKEPDDVTENIIVKKKLKKKPIIKVSEEKIIIKKQIIDQTDNEPHVTTEQIEIKEKPTEKHIPVEVADEVTIQKIVKKPEDQIIDFAEDIIVKHKSKKKPIITESEEVITIEKQNIEPSDNQLQTVTESVTLEKTSTEKLVIEEAADEVTIQEVIETPEDQLDDVIEEINVKKKSKKKPVVKDLVEEITMKKTIPTESVEQPEDITEEIILKRKSDIKPVSKDADDEVMIKKMKIEESEGQPDMGTEEVIIIEKQKKKPTIKETEEKITIKKPTKVSSEKPENVTEEITLTQKFKVKPVTADAADEVTIEKIVVKETEGPTDDKIEEVLVIEKQKKKSIIKETEEKITLKKPITVTGSEPENRTEEITLTEKIKVKPVTENTSDEVTTKKMIIEESEGQPDIKTEGILVSKMQKKKPVIKETEEKITIKKPTKVTGDEPENVTEEITLTRKSKVKPITENALDEVTIEKTSINESEEQLDIETQELLVLKKRKKKPTIKETEEKVTIKKPITLSDVEPENITEKITLKRIPKSKRVTQDASDEVTIEKTIIPKSESQPDNETEEVLVTKKQKKILLFNESEEDQVTIKKATKVSGDKPENVTEKVTLTRKSKVKPVTEDASDEVTIEKMSIEESGEQPDIESEVVLKKQRKKPIIKKPEEQITIKKPIKVSGDEQENVTEEIILTEKSKKKSVTEDASDEVTIKKLSIEESEGQPDVETEEVLVIKKQTKKPTIKETEEKITIKKPITLSDVEPESITEKITLKGKPKLKRVTQDASDEVTIEKTVTRESEEQPDTETKEILLIQKQKKKPSIKETEEQITIKKPTKVSDVGPENVTEKITLKEKIKKKSTTDDASDEITIEKMIVKELGGQSDNETEDVLVMKKQETTTEDDVDCSQKKDDENDSNTFTFKRKPPKLIPKTIDDVYEAITLRKLRPKKKSHPDITELTEVENVTYRPRTTKIREDVDQEFRISLDTYDEENISMSSKIRLKPKKRPLTFSEETDKETIRIIHGPEDEEQLYERSISPDSNTQDDDSIEELRMSDFNLPLRKKKEIVSRPYSVEQFEETIQMKLKGDRKYSVEEIDGSLAMKLKRIQRPSIFEEEEASLSISREADIYDDNEADYMVRENDVMFSICSYIAETDEAINLGEGEKVYVIECTNSDWWFIRKHFTQEKGWVPAQYLLNKENYGIFLQRKIQQKIDKLPVFERASDKSSAPRFLEKLQPQRSLDGYTVQFESQVEGIPKPQITWFKQSAIIKPSADFQMFYDEDNVATLIIREVFPEDAGTYTCVAKNAAGFASSTTELTVEGSFSDHGSEATPHSRKSLSRESSLADILEGIPPTFFRKPRAQYVDENADVILECRLVAVPEPEITWYYGNTQIDSRDNVTVATENDMNMYCSIMRIKRVLKNQEGCYKIIAKNREGEATMDILLKVKTGNVEPPEILEPLQSFVVREGETVVLSTQIVGMPIPHVTWLKNGKPLRDLIPREINGVNSLTLIHSKVSDSGEYTCIATNDVGKAETHATICVEVNGSLEPPLFTQRFQELVVSEKGSFKLVAKVKGMPEPEITWFRNNEHLEKSSNIKQIYDGENIILEIENADSEIDSGNYKCTASNCVGKTSHGAKVTVDVARVIFTKQLPSEVSVSEFKTLELICETSHTVSTTWWHNDQEISGMKHQEVIQDGHLHRLVIKQTSMNDEGIYKCSVKNQTTTCNVFVKPTKPEFIRKLQDFEVTEREVAILEVEITSQTAGVSWLKDGIPLDPQNEKLQFINKGSVRKLLISNTSVHDEGEYTCTLPDQFCSAEVTVVELPPEIITKMKDVRVAMGDRAKFEIELTKGDALVRWFKDAQELQFSEHVRLSIDGKCQKLKIYDVQSDDAGVYACQVGQQTSEASLIVEEPRVDLIKRLQDITLVPLEQDATLVIELSRSDIPVQWFRNGIQIKESQKYTIIHEGLTQKLIVKECTVDDAVEYSAIVLNVRTSTQLKVEVYQSPPKISLESPNEYRGKIGENIDIIVRFSASPIPIAEWQVNGKVVIETKRVSTQVDEESATLTVKNIRSEDAGEYTLRLSNTYGEENRTIKLIVGYRPEKPNGPVTFIDITHDSVTIEWKPPLNDGGYNITKYVIDMSDTTKNTWSQIAEVDRDILRYKFGNLQKDIEYIFRLMAMNEVGLSEPLKSSPVKVKSSYDKPGSPRGPLEISAMNETSFTIQWEHPLTDGGTPIIEYIVEIKEMAEESWRLLGTTAFDQPFIDVTNLKADTSYVFKIVARNITGSGLPYTSTEPIALEKKATPPSCPLNFHVSNITSRSVTLNWVPPASTGYSELTGYVIEKKPLTDKSSKWLKVVTLDASVHQYCLENLKESEFHFRIFAENCIGLSTPSTSEIITLKTHATIPSPPTAPLEIRQIAAHTVVIEWGRPESDGGAVLEDYKIAIRDLKKTMWIEVGRVNTDIQKLNVRDLQEDHEYLVRIYARNEIGFSEALESDEPFKIIPGSEITTVEPIAEEITDRGETASLSYSTDNTSSWLREHNMDADISSYARARLIRKDEYFFRIWHYAKKLFN